MAMAHTLDSRVASSYRVGGFDKLSSLAILIMTAATARLASGDEIVVTTSGAAIGSAMASVTDPSSFSGFTTSSNSMTEGDSVACTSAKFEIIICMASSSASAASISDSDTYGSTISPASSNATWRSMITPGGGD